MLSLVVFSGRPWRGGGKCSNRKFEELAFQSVETHGAVYVENAVEEDRKCHVSELISPAPPNILSSIDDCLHVESNGLIKFSTDPAGYQNATKCIRCCPHKVSFSISIIPGHGPLVPYGLPCVRELLRFLISLVNPHDR